MHGQLSPVLRVPLSTAVYRERLPRAPGNFFGHATVCLELLMEGTQQPSKWRGFSFLLCMDFSEKGNRIISSLL